MCATSACVCECCWILLDCSRRELQQRHPTRQFPQLSPLEVLLVRHDAECHSRLLVKSTRSPEIYSDHRRVLRHACVFPRLHVLCDCSRLSGDGVSSRSLGSRPLPKGSRDQDSGSTRPTAIPGSSHRRSSHCDCDVVFPDLLSFFGQQCLVGV